LLLAPHWAFAPCSLTVIDAVKFIDNNPGTMAGYRINHLRVNGLR
jgi:hypothetical protein